MILLFQRALPLIALAVILAPLCGSMLALLCPADCCCGEMTASPCVEGACLEAPQPGRGAAASGAAAFVLRFTKYSSDFDIEHVQIARKLS